MSGEITRKVVNFGGHRRLVWIGQTASADHWDANWSELDVARSIDSARADIEFLPLFESYVNRGARTLEAGCGLAQWVFVLRERGFTSFGVDYVIEALRTATAHFPHDGVLARGDIRGLPFADNSFDAVTSFGVVEHFWQGPSPLIHEMVRVLRPGGLMFLSVPYFNLLRKSVTWPGRPEDIVTEPQGFYQFGFEKRELLDHLRAAGLEIEQSIGMGPAKGLKDELRFAGALRRRLNAVATSGSGYAGSRGTATASRPRSYGGILRTILQRIIYTRFVSGLTGHMIMVVCRKSS